MSARPTAARGSRRRASRPQLEVVRRRSKGLIQRGPSTRLAPAVIVATIVVATLIFGILLEQVMLAQSAFKLAELRREVIAVESRHEDLLLEAARLGSPIRISRFAQSRLGMVQPSKAEFVVADVPGLARYRPAQGRALADIPSEGFAAGAGGYPIEDSP